jgi:competence protein ComEA
VLPRRRLPRRQQPPDVDLAARVSRLLLPNVPGGWTPPPETGVDDERDDAVTVPAARPVEVSWSPRHPPSPDVVPVPPLLPATLRGGRLDPGHRGAVALLLVCVLAAVVAAGVVWRGRPQEVAVPALEQPGEVLPGAPTPSAEPADEVVVAVVGTVVSPGVVRLPPGSRVEDAVRAAGGLAPGGSYGLLNLARKLVDGEQVLVGIDPPPGAPPAAGAGSSGGGLVDLNAASASDLDALPGIGPVLAERIVEWRTENGGFRSVDQLREVPGIGEAKYASLKSKVAV